MGSQKELKNEKRTAKVGAGKKRFKVPFSEFRFVRIELTEQEKNSYRQLLESGEFDEIPLDEWLASSYKVSLSADGEGGGVVASITSVYSDSPNAGLVLTARGRSAVSALAVLTYKDRYLAGEDGWLACESGRGGSYSDIG